ncbi:uncharacterized protein FIBRA_05038 [Fibroporia radiculosa]|uniref:Uncharacterized protein n=1 Tax=Fibroporia radiculosa TaxID=599839 RepID=J4H3A3_9APHY|nr:uncharacterized protein FIBRA_05038 [Fibroporia radiculosa]CCM02924.1 predicted protein [Fibroporia radiculosa]
MRTTFVLLMLSVLVAGLPAQRRSEDSVAILKRAPEVERREGGFILSNAVHPVAAAHIAPESRDVAAVPRKWSIKLVSD